MKRIEDLVKNLTKNGLDDITSHYGSYSLDLITGSQVYISCIRYPDENGNMDIVGRLYINGAGTLIIANAPTYEELVLAIEARLKQFIEYLGPNFALKAEFNEDEWVKAQDWIR